MRRNDLKIGIILLIIIIGVYTALALLIIRPRINLDLTTVISIIAILLTAGVAIYNINRIAKQQRLTVVHKELVSCLIDSISLIIKERIAYIKLEEVEERQIGDIVKYNENIKIAGKWGESVELSARQLGLLSLKL